jgi:hypothetical protein
MSKIFVLIFTLCLSLFGNRLSAFSAEKPNVLIILVLDLGYADLGVQGLKEVATPSSARKAAATAVTRPPPRPASFTTSPLISAK